MNNSVFGKTMENVRKRKYLCTNINTNIACDGKKKRYLVSKPSYHTTKWFSGNLLAIETKKKGKMNKPVYIGLHALDISKTAIYAIWIQIVLYST